MAAALCLCSCIGPTTSAPPSQLDIQVRSAQKVSADAEVERSSEAMHSYLVGQLAYAGEDFKTALENFSAASRLIKEPEPELHSRLAELYVKSGELDKALAESEKALQTAPNDPQRMLLHAGILESLKRFDQAEPVYRSLIESNPTMSEPYILLAALYAKTERLPKAVEALRALIVKVPDEPSGFYYLAHAFEEQGDLAQAEKQLLRAHELSRGNHDLTLDLVRVYLKERKVDEAKNALSEVLEADPKHVLARRVMGQIMLGENKLEDALEHLTVLETLEKDSAETRFKVALIQMQRQNYKEAVNELNLVLAQNPKHEHARYYLGSVYAASGKRKEALKELAKIKQDQELFVKGRLFSAFIQREDGDLDGSERSIREAYQREPDNKRTFSYLILLLRERHKFDEAEKLLRGALAVEPRNDKLLFQHAVVLHDLGRDAESMAGMEQVIKLNPRHSDALNYVAYGLAESGKDMARAEELVKAALEVKPNDGYYLDTLGWIYFKQGRLADAEEILAQAANGSEEDIVVVEHYGDCLIALQKFEKAAEVLQAAIDRSSASTSAEQRRVVERIKVKLERIKSPLSVNPVKAAH